MWRSASPPPHPPPRENQLQGQSQSPECNTLGVSSLPTFLRTDMPHDLISVHNGMHIPGTGQPCWHYEVSCKPKSTGSNRKLASRIPTFFSATQQPKTGLGYVVVAVFRSHTIRHTTPGRTPLNEWPAHRRGLYLHNKHMRLTAMPSAAFEPLIPAIK
jgi:hypothetical protein